MRALNRLLISVSLCCFVATANAAPIDDATAAYIKGDYAQAFKLFRPLAAEGNSSSQNALGFMYVQGLGVTRNYQEAVKWHSLAAAEGNVIAQFNLGVMHHRGTGVSKDYELAYFWWLLSSKSGDQDSINSLSYLEKKLMLEQRENALAAAAKWSTVGKLHFLRSVDAGMKQDWSQNNVS